MRVLCVGEASDEATEAGSVAASPMQLRRISAVTAASSSAVCRLHSRRRQN